MSINIYEEIIAVEGVFIQLSEEKNLAWKWEDVKLEIDKILSDNTTMPEDLIIFFCEKAKVSGDYLKNTTKN